ncbi:MAG TPA: hypothetical protein VKG63_01030 [Steroidobacteraceae bacterium]|nr:hypothetical protein [Steroidobacteraceae bacterium]
MIIRIISIKKKSESCHFSLYGSRARDRLWMDGNRRNLDFHIARQMSHLSNADYEKGPSDQHREDAGLDPPN